MFGLQTLPKKDHLLRRSDLTKCPVSRPGKGDLSPFVQVRSFCDPNEHINQPAPRLPTRQLAPNYLSCRPPFLEKQHLAILLSHYLLFTGSQRGFGVLSTSVGIDLPLYPFKPLYTPPSSTLHCLRPVI